MANTILLKGRGIRQEGVAGGTITPGHLVTFNNTGKLIVHATAGGNAMKMFAVENDIEGDEISDNYVADDYVQAEILPPGGEVLALVAANASAIVIGDYLESAGDGTLRKLDTGIALAQAIQAVDNSSGGSPARIQVKLL